jgi:hypothetical protein
MKRRVVHVMLLLAGIAPAVWAVWIFSSDPRRASVLAALAILGLGLNGTALANPSFGMRAPLRLIACGVALVVLAGVLAMWQWLRNDFVPGLPVADVAGRGAAVMAAHNLVWIAAAVGYVLLTVLVLPSPAKTSEPPRDKPGARIDSRRFSR